MSRKCNGRPQPGATAGTYVWITSARRHCGRHDRLKYHFHYVLQEQPIYPYEGLQNTTRHGGQRGAGGGATCRWRCLWRLVAGAGGGGMTAAGGGRRSISYHGTAGCGSRRKGLAAEEHRLRNAALAVSEAKGSRPSSHPMQLNNSYFHCLLLCARMHEPALSLALHR